MAVRAFLRNFAKSNLYRRKLCQKLSDFMESSSDNNMIPRIKSFVPLEDFQLRITFDDGRVVRYDVMDDIRTIPAFRDLEAVHGLFQNAQLDQSRTCIYWNSEIDLPSDTLYEYGTSETDALFAAEERFNYGSES